MYYSLEEIQLNRSHPILTSANMAEAEADFSSLPLPDRFAHKVSCLPLGSSVCLGSPTHHRSLSLTHGAI